MSLFSQTPKVKKTKAKETPVSSVPKEKKASHTKGGELSRVLIAPWFSEKALIGTEKSVYVFAVPVDATKHQVAKAIEQIYSVKPVKVHMVHLPAKKKPLRGRRGVGVRARRHKAYVYLKKGETITLA